MNEHSRLRQLTTMAVLVAIGTLSSQFIWFPAGIAKAYPVQHAINVLTAALFGPLPALTVAFLIGLMRNILGVGTLFAFPGGMIGALLAGLFYRRKQLISLAATGEVIGTVLLGTLVSVPIARLFFSEGNVVVALFPGFLVSSVTGAMIGAIIVRYLRKVPAIENMSKQKATKKSN